MFNPIDQPWKVEDCKCGDPICTSAQISGVVTGQGAIKRELANHVVELHNEFLKKDITPTMQKFILHWRGGMSDQVVEGCDITDACNRAGIGQGAIPALDYYEPLVDVTEIIKEHEEKK